MTDKRIFPSDSLVSHYSLPTWGQPPAPRAKGLVKNPAILDFRKVDNSI